MGDVVNPIIVGVVCSLFAAAVTYLWQERRRALLLEELESLRTAAAVAETRLAQAREQAESLARERAAALEAQAQADAKRVAVESDLRVAQTRIADSTDAEQRLRAELAATQLERKGLADALTQVKATHAALQERYQGLAEQMNAQKAWIEAQTLQLEERVTKITKQLLDEKSDALAKTSRKELDSVVGPFKEQLTEFRTRVDHIYAAENRERGQLVQQITQLTSLNQAVSRQAEQLTNALTISSKATGDWGETILEKILQDSGLRAGREYELQHAIAGNDGERYQADAVIFLPDNRQLVIDAKVSNKAWKDYCSEAVDSNRQEFLDRHLAALRAHVKGLSAKDYARSPDLQTVDFVLMFVPVEAALLTALATDESLYGDAYRAKIILVTPSTLMAVVKLVEGIWTFQKRKESADEIAEAGRKLYEKLTTFASSFVDIGEAIEKAHDTFEKARGQLSTGKGNAIKLAQRMVDLGVAPSQGKVMAPALLTGDDDDSKEPEG